MKHTDNLKVEGEFTKRVAESWTVGQKAEVVRRADNLAVEKGNFATKTVNQSYGTNSRTASANKSVAKRNDASFSKSQKTVQQDTLKLEGKFAQREESRFNASERAEKVFHQDNLKLEGTFAGRDQSALSTEKRVNGKNINLGITLLTFLCSGQSQESRAQHAKAVAASRAKQLQHENSSKTQETSETDFKRRGTITLSSSADKTESAQSSASIVKTSQVSSGITSAMQQTGTETASISAVSKDKFVSSLRESSGLNIGAQKEMSVIEQHRKSSLQKQRMTESWDTRATGFSVEAHTGRTAAYGGRDYESSKMVSASAKSQQRTAASSSSRQSLSSSWAVQEQTSRNVSASHQRSSQASASHQSSLSMMQQNQASTQAFHQRSSQASASQQSSLAMMQQNQASAQASTRRDVSASSLGHSSFGQEQVTGFARNLGTSHSALIKSDQVIRHEQQSSSSSAAQRVERSQGGRRRTWAESSMMHGGAAAIGQSIYAQDYHQPICPASKVYADTSAFQYERQSNSGHKMFRKK